MLSLAILSIAGLFLAGGLNAVAGGRTFLSFPALVWLGVPPIMANATATLTAMPGYIGCAWAYRQDVAAEGTLRLRAIILVAIVGGLAGAALLLVTPGEAFVGIVPWLLLAATCLFAAGPQLLAAVRARGRGAAGPLLSAAAILGVSIYGGLGIMLLAVLGLIGFTNLHGMKRAKEPAVGDPLHRLGHDLRDRWAHRLGLRPWSRHRDHDRRLRRCLAGAAHSAHPSVAHRNCRGRGGHDRRILRRLTSDSMLHRVIRQNDAVHRDVPRHRMDGRDAAVGEPTPITRGNGSRPARVRS